jgi:CheY-like chemotaxis protein
MAKVLIVDDDYEMCSLMRSWLIKAGHDITEAHDGEEAIEAQKRDPAEIVVLDLIMPVKEGIETMSILRRDYPNLGIIAVTGGGLVSPEEHLKWAEKFGANRFMRKPFESSELLQHVAALEEAIKDSNGMN